MKRGEIDVAIVGTDRTVAVLCHRHGIPFYVAAPTSTIDLALPTGDSIPIEERSGDEVRTVFGHPVAAADVKVRNPAFDVTPAELVSAIITEHGIARAPYGPSLRALVGGP